MKSEFTLICFTISLGLMCGLCLGVYAVIRLFRLVVWQGSDPEVLDSPDRACERTCFRSDLK
jgi:hypothetical protein